MAEFDTLQLGKGIKEPCAPNRELVVFGAALNKIDIPVFNCQPVILDEASTFNLAALTPNHEVVCAWAPMSESAVNATKVTFKWFKGLTMVYQYSYTVGAGSYVWGIFSYIGYIPSEISQNGEYSVSLSVNDVIIRDLPFSITGIPAPLKPSNTPLLVGAGIATLIIAALVLKRKKR